MVFYRLFTAFLWENLGFSSIKAITIYIFEEMSETFIKKQATIKL